ncbi:hypothetical protein Fot_17504 [Forsythia ovata]|uniref:Uncharacterized protein n=1 Tax=Forsythia ovata TaxID=205694 RepID=A0ABD1VFM3_9LAMI
MGLWLTWRPYRNRAVTVTILLRLNGDTIVPGRVRSLETNLHFFNGIPYRTEFFSNADAGNPNSELGISPASALPETLKSCKLGQLKTRKPVSLQPQSKQIRQVVQAQINNTREIIIRQIKPVKLRKKSH